MPDPITRFFNAVAKRYVEFEEKRKKAKARDQDTGKTAPDRPRIQAPVGGVRIQAGSRCKVCGLDVSNRPAVRDNLTGAMYCFDHREYAGR